MAENSIYEVGNVSDTSKFKPSNTRYNDSWIEFWMSEVGTNKPQNCCVMDCTHEKPVTSDDIVGGHVYMSIELTKTVEADLNSFCTYPSRRSFNGFSVKNGYWFKSYGNLLVMMRCGDELIKTTGGNLICIAPICNSCNQRGDKFLLKNNTVLVPLYWSDQKEVE